jgi:hypothetical protein
VKTTSIMRRLPPLFAGVIALMLGGCQLAKQRMEAAGYFAATQAGYAGRFRLAYGRWPANVNELEEFMCMRGRAEKFKLARFSCDQIVTLTYSTELIPEGKHLGMRFRDSNHSIMCSLRVWAPSPEAGAQFFPQIRISTTMTACTRAPIRHNGHDGKRWIEGAP